MPSQQNPRSKRSAQSSYVSAKPPRLHEMTASTPSQVKESKTEQVVSCAECRRLKLKCNRQWPCTNCVKRGCARICPTGKMKTGKGKRMILADTEELHQRIAELEGALQRSHVQQSADPHPLLIDSFQYAPLDLPPALTPKTARAVPQEPVEADERGTGLLLLGSEGKARFVGASAGSEFFDTEPMADIEVAMLTPPTTARAISPPESHDHLPSPPRYNLHTEVLDEQIMELRSYLPDWDREGRSLIEQYWENVNWLHQIIPRPVFDADYLPFVLDPRMTPPIHKLACVFLMMALGAQLDLYREPNDVRATELFDLGHACLSLAESQQPTLSLVQALHLSSTYVLNSQDPNGAETVWPVIGSTIKLAQSLGLHRDGEFFRIPAIEVRGRRQIWWELVGSDRLQALCLGRPCATRNAHTDTGLPESSASFADQDGFHRSKAKLTEVLDTVIELQSQVAPVAVAQIREADKLLCQLRDELPPTLLPNVPIGKLPMEPNIHPHMVLHRYTIRFLIAQARLVLNRPAFARALQENPIDPMSAKSQHCFVAAYESAQTIVQCVKQLIIFHPSLISRWWFFWFHAFSSAVCLAAIPIRAPQSSLAAPAFNGLCSVLEIAYATAPGCRARKGLPVLFRLRKKAAAAMQAVGRPQCLLPIPFNRPGDDQLRAEETRDADDLAHLRRVGAGQLGRLSRSISGDARISAQLRLGNRVSATRRPEISWGPARTPSAPSFVPPIQAVLEFPPSEIRVRGIESTSPLSVSAFSATSTLAEPVFYDSNGPHGPTPSLSALGAVPPLAPMEAELAPHNEDTAWAHLTPPPTSTWLAAGPTNSPLSIPWTADGRMESDENGNSQGDGVSMVWEEDLERAFGLQPDLRFANLSSSSPLASDGEVHTPKADFDWSIFMNVVGDLDM